MVSENSPFNTVSCGADPLSLRPALDVLEVEVRRRNPTPERPLMVVIGEDHYMPTHTWLRHGLIARLCAGSSPLALAYGMETPHDELTRDAYPLFREMKSPHDILTAQKSDLNLQRFCQDKKISIAGNDAAIKWPNGVGFLNRFDNTTYKAIEKYVPSFLGQEIDAQSPEGMEVRNHVIVAHALQHRKDTEAAVYIQSCGGTHVLGGDDYPFATSLSALFINAAVDVLPVYIAYSDCDLTTLSKDALSVLQSRGIVVKGLGENDTYSARDFRL